MTQETQAVLDDEDQMATALAEIRAERSEDQSSSIDTAPVEPDPIPEAQATPEPAQAEPESAAQPDPVEVHKAKSEEGRVAALNRKYMEAAREAAQLREELARSRQQQAQPAATVPDAVSKLDSIAEQVKDFPELSGIVSAVRDAMKQSDLKTEEVARRVAAQMVEPLEPLRREQTTRMQTERQAAFDAAMKTFNSTYPTAAQVVQTDEFNSWLRSQPGNVQYAFDKGQTPMEAMTVLDTYDMHLRRSGKSPIAQFSTQSDAPPAQRIAPNTNRLQRAAGLPSRSSGSQGGQPPADDFDASLAYFRNKRLAAQRAAA